MKSTTIQVRVDEDLKKNATAIFEKTGLDMSSAVKLFLQQAVNRKGIPFHLLADDYPPVLYHVSEDEVSDDVADAYKKAKALPKSAFVSLGDED